MTPELRNAITQGRLDNYTAIMRTTIFTLTGVAAVIELGPGGYSAPLTMLVVTTCAYGILAGGVALDDVTNLRESMDDDTANSAYGRAALSRNLPMLKMTSAVLLGLVGLAELFAIFT